jgi:hypothetical protein
MFLFLFEEAPIHFVEIALQQRGRLAERVDLGGPTRLEHFDLVAFHLRTLSSADRRAARSTMS